MEPHINKINKASLFILLKDPLGRKNSRLR